MNDVLYKFSKDITNMNAEDLKLYARDYYYINNKNLCELFGIPGDEKCLAYLHFDMMLANSYISLGLAKYDPKTGEVTAI